MSTTSSEKSGWIGVDLDRTLAEYDFWRGAGHIGAPIPEMLQRVRKWLADGWKVKLFTARVSGSHEETVTFLRSWTSWSMTHFGQVLPVTCSKDFHMIELWDDRAVAVANGRPVLSAGFLG